ncbi:Na+/H+ antiporter [Methylobacterium persicinum]|uniref:CPA1 family monovalent cation:H+ antiporter n=1 Tax=Methylobacterium persicinum TaxID=374426 RepID=A0ABU0HMM2_9HYPH|nr:Na+/H+ antiporter [Methylobacterium persicinum]MDQ0443583.1 CPA1 family monovalent cation:H+ antiporter [Methylobacterium persicinum]GJE36838.1 K(+)/H(+) antiporter NhaP2 [Methylobacterium persicinum]
MTPVALFELVLALLSAALVLSLAAARLGLPPAAALVVGGMALAFAPGLPAFDLDPDLIMGLFLPPLLLESAYFTVWRDFRASLGPILSLSLGAVMFTTLVVGLVAHWVVPGLPWAACFALGAIVSPPDAVSAKAVLARVTLPRKTVTVLEGESLVNDASGLVLYRFAVAAALTGAFDAFAALGSFAWLAAAGIAVGVALGFAANWAIGRLQDTDATTVVTFLVAYLAYLAAEEIHASGVLAVVACGLMLGGREHETFDARTRTHALAVWGFVVFLLEALVFVLIGLALRGVLTRMGGSEDAVLAGLPLALATTAACVVARLAWVFPAVHLSQILARRRSDAPPPLSPAIPLVIGWAGMRGVVTLAAALALPLGFPGRDPILLASFAVILFTVLVQGTTLGPLIRRLRLGGGASLPDGHLDASMARVAVNQAALSVLESLQEPETGAHRHPRLVEQYRLRVWATSRLRDERQAAEPERDAHFMAALAAVQAGRKALIALHRDGVVHSSVLRTLEAELDLEELHLRQIGGESAGHG